MDRRATLVRQWNAEYAAGNGDAAMHILDEIDVIDANHRELTFDECDAIGLDGTGRDLNPRFPYTLDGLTPDELTRLRHWYAAPFGGNLDDGTYDVDGNR